MSDEIVVDEQIYITIESIKYRETANDYAIKILVDPNKVPESWKQTACENCDRIVNEKYKNAPGILSIGKKDEQV